MDPLCSWTFPSFDSDTLSSLHCFFFLPPHNIPVIEKPLFPLLYSTSRYTHWCLNKSCNMPKSHTQYVPNNSGNIYLVSMMCQVMCQALRPQEWKRQHPCKGLELRQERESRQLLSTCSETAPFTGRCWCDHYFDSEERIWKKAEWKQNPEADRKGEQTVVFYAHELPGPAQVQPLIKC